MFLIVLAPQPLRNTQGQDTGTRYGWLEASPALEARLRRAGWQIVGRTDTASQAHQRLLELSVPSACVPVLPASIFVASPQN